MDPVSQGLLGATVAGLVAPRAELRSALALGFLAGCAADLDVLIPPGRDPLGVLEHHRHFSHALLFIPLGGALVALALFPVFRRVLRPLRQLLYAVLGYATHGPLDALTTYGTHLFWPFAGDAVATGTIAVVDPLFTLLLGATVLFAAARRAPGASRIGFVFCLAYFSLGFVQRARADAVVETLARSRGHVRERPLVKVTMGNQLLWRSVYVSGGRYWVDAVRVGWTPRVYPGTSIPVLDPERDLPDAPVLRRHVERFVRFSLGYVGAPEAEPDFLGDVRYSALPNGVRPLWGLRFSPTRPETPVVFEQRERITPAERSRFLDMLLGRSL